MNRTSLLILTLLLVIVIGAATAKGQWSAALNGNMMSIVSVIGMAAWLVYVGYGWLRHFNARRAS